MSEEAENAAVRQLHDRFDEANTAKAALQTKLVSLGERLERLSTALRSPGNYTFDVSDNIVAVGERSQPGELPFAYVNTSDLNWEDLCVTLRGYLKASEDRADAARLLRDSGIPVGDD